MAAAEVRIPSYQPADWEPSSQQDVEQKTVEPNPGVVRVLFMTGGPTRQMRTRYTCAHRHSDNWTIVLVGTRSPKSSKHHEHGVAHW